MIFNKKEEQKQNRSQSIIWFNPPFSRNVITNVAKRFLNLLDIRVPKSNKVYKIFTETLSKLVTVAPRIYQSSIIKTYNKKVTNENLTPKNQCKRKNKSDCPLDGDYQTSDIIYKCIA